ncbi:MAG: RNA polymerase sigma factor [Bryobacteraceae bacterium]
MSALKELSDEELYRLMRKGNQLAFAQLYERRQPAIYRYALHMSGSRAAGEEIANEVFVRLMGPSAGFDERRGSLEAYLFGVARNLVQVLRRKGRVEEQQDQAIEHDLVGDLIKKEMVAALYAAMDALPDRYRDVVVLCELEERSYAEAARLLACPVGTIRSRLHRARLFLAARLKPVGIVSEVAAQ